MKNKYLGLIKVIGIFGILCFVGCVSNQKHSGLSHKVSPATQISEDNSVVASRVKRLDGKPCERKVDWEANYQSGLKQHGITDFNTTNLIALLDSDNESIAMFSAWLLGARKEFSAIPKLEQLLAHNSYYIKMAATESLLKMGNRKGIPIVKQMCEEYAEQVKEGDERNLTHLSSAVIVLADANEISAIPYLRKLAAYHGEYSWSIRLDALRSIAKLYEKDPSVLSDIASMENDENPQIRKEAKEILQRIEAKK
jgi:hypothetical protein